MSANEIFNRLNVFFRKQLEKTGLFFLKRIPAWKLNEQNENWIRFRIEEPAFELYCHAADRILLGRLTFFVFQDILLGHPPEWNRDPQTGVMAPLIFGKSLDYRDNEMVGDIKCLWELNRHLHMVTLAQAYHCSGYENYLKGIQTQIQSWIKQCPYPLGPNWSSSLELAIRLINWSILWQLIGGSAPTLLQEKIGQNFFDDWLKSIYKHCYFIKRNLASFSSANNHLIGEVAGLFIAAQTWPYWDKMDKWGEQAKGILEQECLKQNAPDGVNREQTTAYQQFVLDFLLLSALAGKANGVRFSKDYWARIEAMLECLASFMDVGGHMPMIGDADDGYVVRLSQERDFNPYRSLLATGAVLFKRSDFKSKAGRFDHKSMWLLGQEGKREFDELGNEPVNLTVRRHFPEGGYYILGKDFETQKEIKGLVDSGPLGYLSIAAHGHADALSFVLSIGGEEFLIDPGTYAYHTKERWRDYFRGTSAHNTVRIDGLNQSVIGGNFMWLKKAEAYCSKFKSSEAEDLFEGWHDGYKRLKDPVVHLRRIVFKKDSNTFIVTDTLQCKKRHTAEFYWHFAEHCSVEMLQEGCRVVNNGKILRLKSHCNQVQWRLYQGNKELPLGWVSRQFDVKVPCSTVVGRLDLEGKTEIKTEIGILLSYDQNACEEF